MPFDIKFAVNQVRRECLKNVRKIFENSTNNDAGTPEDAMKEDAFLASEIMIEDLDEWYIRYSQKLEIYADIYSLANKSVFFIEAVRALDDNFQQLLEVLKKCRSIEHVRQAEIIALHGFRHPKWAHIGLETDLGI